MPDLEGGLFRDEDVPEDNPLLDNMKNWRDEYFQEDTPLTKVGWHPTKDDPDDEAAGPPGLLKGTTAGDAWSLVSDIQNGKVPDATAGALGLASTALSIAMDPAGWAGGQIINWMLTHFEPFRMILDGLAGNDDVVHGYAKSWQAVSKKLESISTGWQDSISKDIASWTGAGADAYRNYANDFLDTVNSAAGVAQCLAELMNAAAGVVKIVRDAAQSLCADLLGSLAGWTAEELCSFGFATPHIVEAVIARCSSVALKMSRILGELGKAFSKLAGYASKAVAILDVLIGKRAERLQGESPI